MWADQVTPKAIARSPLFLADQVWTQPLATVHVCPHWAARCSHRRFAALQTCAAKGFEEPTLFQAPDGLLHFIGHNHGRCASGEKYAHFVSQNRSLANWLEAPPFGLASGKPHDSSSLFFVC